MANLETEYASWKTSGESNTDAFLNEVLKKARKIVWSRCPEYADDIASEATIRVWRTIDQFDPAKSSITHWVRMTANAALNRHLATVYRRQAEVSMDFETFDVSEDDRPSSNYGRLLAAFGEDKPLLDLLLAGHSLTESAAELGLSRAALRHKLTKINLAQHDQNPSVELN